MARNSKGGAVSLSPALRLGVAVCLGGLAVGFIGARAGFGADPPAKDAPKVPRNTLPSSAAGKRATGGAEAGPKGVSRNRVGPRPKVPHNVLPHPRPPKLGDVLKRGNPLAGSGAGGEPPAPPRPHRANPRHHAGRDPHASWIHGNWDGNWGSNHRWDWEGIATRAVASGLASWKVGSAVYDWGYAPYANPYCPKPSPAKPFDYSRPIDTESPAPEPAIAESAVDLLDEARAAFKAGDAPKALELADRSLGSLPNDSAIHELRALILFALKRYDESAATLHAVLSVGPGWDWTTLARLYPSVDAYASQLRALEDYRDDHPDSASAHFVLAYHYLTAGHADTAEEELKEAARLKPGDHLTGQLIVIVDPSAAKPDAAVAVAVAVADKSDIPPPSPPDPSPSRKAEEPTKAAEPPKAEEPPKAPVALAALSPSPTPTPPKLSPSGAPMPDPSPAGRPAGIKARPPSASDFAGTWKASPTKGLTIDLAIQPNRTFSWTVTGERGTGKTLSGEFTYGGETLALVQSNGTSMVGWLAWEDDNHFHFRIAGSIPDRPNLKFSR